MLYLGSSKVADLDTDRDIVAIDRKGEIEPNQREILKDIEGVVLLDGTWSQAKALWWRNAWMLKCQRVILGPSAPSRYGKLRKEPRRDGLSTLEAAAMLLGSLEKRPDIEAALLASFDRMLARFREVQAAMPELAPKPKKRDYRRRKKRPDRLRLPIGQRPYKNQPMGPRGGVVTRRSAKPFTPVQFRAWPPAIFSST